MLGTSPLSYRPLVASQLPGRAFAVASVAGEYGYAAWSYSRQAKLNAWSWNGVGKLLNVTAWAVLGNAVYMRNEADSYVYIKQPDVFYAQGDSNPESTSAEAVTQWLDFGKPGNLKALYGIDFDGKGVTSVEVYVSVGGDRAGVLADTILVGSSQGGWTYSGDMLPVEAAGTEFKLRFIGDANKEVQVNRLSLHFEDMGAA